MVPSAMTRFYMEYSIFSIPVKITLFKSLFISSFLKKNKDRELNSHRDRRWKGQFLQGWHEKHVTSKNVYFRDKVHSHVSHHDKPLLVAKNHKLSRFLTSNTLWHLLRCHPSRGGGDLTVGGEEEGRWQYLVFPHYCVFPKPYLFIESELIEGIEIALHTNVHG